MSYLPNLSNLLSNTTSRYASLRRNILSTTTEDDTSLTDPEDSHVSRVLRAYYTEKQRPFPAWLGVDPREAAKAQQREQQQYVTARPMGSLRGSSNSSMNDGRGGGLSDLWADSSTGHAPVEERGGSLRRGPLGGGRRAPASSASSMQQEQGLSVRPLPSQRAGSYQTQLAQARGDSGRSTSPVPPGSSGGGGSVQERLKARLGRGGGGGTPPLEGRGSYDGRPSGGGSYDGRSSGGGSYDEGRYGGGEGRRDGGSYATKGLSGWQGRR